VPDDAAGRVVLWLLAADWLWALLRLRSHSASRGAASAAPAVEGHARLLSPALIARCLVLFNALFAVQTALDVYYLWGGAKLPAGMTYAHYAHRGAYPLAAAALLAAACVLVTFRAAPREGAMRWARRLVYVWLGQNVFLVVSAAWRLRLYVEAYSLTRLRVAAAIWMLLVACGLAWILMRILTGRANLWLINVNTITAAAVLYACCLVDFDGAIARFNVRHCSEVRGQGPSIDLEYLEALGPETLPALLWLSDRIGASPKAAPLQETIGRLADGLHRDLRSWQGWTFRRHRLARLRRMRSLGAARPGVPPLRRPPGAVRAR